MPCSVIDRYNVPGKYNMEMPRYSGTSVTYNGYKSGSTGHDNVKQLRLAALKMSQVGNNVKNCKASIRLNSFPKGKYKYLTKKRISINSM